MTNSTRCTLLAKLACTTFSHVVQKITPPSANNFLKLFFALFAMLALGVGNAWGAALGSGYEKVTDISTLSAGDRVVLYADDISKGVTGWDGNKDATVAESGWVEYLVEGATGGVYLKDETANNYIASPASSNVFKYGTKAVCSVNASGVITCGSKYLYNQSTYFRMYADKSSDSKYKPFYVYKVVTTGGSETPDPTTYTIKWHTAKGVTTDVTLNEGATINKPDDPTMTGYEFMGWTEDCSVASDGSDFTALTDFGTADSDKDFYAVFAKATITDEGGAATEVTDVLNRTTTGVTSSSYETWSKKTATSTAIYAGQSAGSYSSIQLRSNNNNSGIVTTASGGKVKKVVVVWESENTANGRTLDIYGKSTAYSEASDLYDTLKKGTKIGSIVKGTSTELTISGDYEYIGFRSNSGALYLTSVSITWVSEGTGTGTTTYSDYITTCASGIEYVELGDDFKWSATEAEVTIDATDNEFPTLTNTHNVPVTYSSSDDAIATIADGAVTLKKEGTVTIQAKYAGGTSAGTGKEYKAKTVDYTLTVKPAPLEPIAGGVIDILDNDWSGLTTSDYATVTAKTAANTGHSNAQYTAQCAGSNSSIQLRSNNSNSGIVSTVSGGLVKRVEIEWNDETSAGRTLNIYGSNTPYTNPTDLYDTNKDGDKLGTIVKGTSTHLEISEDYRYIGLRSASGAMYLTKVTITWLPIKSKVSIDDAIQHGSISVSGATDLNAVAAGTELTLDNNPTTGYKLAAYDVYKTDDATTKVTVADGKFIMPEFDVTISAAFVAAKTLTSIEITTSATQKTFWQGETFNYTGLEVTAHFDGAADEVVTPTVTGSTTAAGTQTVTVSYTEGTTTKTATYTITVKAIPNTQETAYTVAEAYDIIDKLTTAEGVFIKGIVSQVDSYSETYKSITYWISDDGTTTNQLQVYGGKGLEKADFSGKTDLSVGDQVIVVGNLKKYNSTYEFDANNYLASHTPTTKDPADLAYATTEYTANVGEAFATPELTNPYGLPITYSTSDASKATVDVNTGAVTIVAAGEVTITASTTGDATHDAGTASYTITISDPSLAIAQLPFTYNSGKAAIETTAGITHSGLGSDYTTAGVPPLKFDTEGDNVIVRYDQQAGDFSFVLKQNGQTAGTFTVYESANGEDYTPVWTGGDLGNAQSETITPTLAAASRYVKFEYTTKPSGTNYGLGSISIAKPDLRQEAGIAWNPATVSLTVGDAFTAPTLSNPNGLTVSLESSNTDLATVTDAGVISLVSGKKGTATITATFAGDENYKAAEVTCVITVSPKSEKVVILAQYGDQWYALKAAYLSGKTDRLDAILVNYVGGKLYNVAEADKASIEWSSVVEGDKVSFINDGKYLKGKTTTTLLFEEDADGLYQWDNTTYTMTIGTTVRSFLYNGEAFRNFAVSNAGKVVDGTLYSSLPVVTAPVYATGTITPMEDLTPQMYGTICLENNVVGYEGITFYKVAGKEGNKVIFDEVTELEAGMPYIYIADSETATIVKGDETAATPGYYNSLQGTFTQIDPAESNILTDNYILYNNVIKMCGKNCGLKDHKAYFIASGLNGLSAPQAQMPGRRRVSLNTTGENAATGIGDVVVPTEQATKVIINGQLIIIRDGEKFNAQGQRL